jgi:hypothetical protein
MPLTLYLTLSQAGAGPNDWERALMAASIAELMRSTAARTGLSERCAYRSVMLAAEWPTIRADEDEALSSGGSGGHEAVPQVMGPDARDTGRGEDAPPWLIDVLGRRGRPTRRTGRRRRGA